MARQAWDQPAPEAAAGARPNAAGMSRSDLAALLARLGEPAWRGKQVFQGLMRQRWHTWEQFSSLSKPLRARLQAEVDLVWPRILQSQTSSDGSTKHAFGLGDGCQIEGVHMPYAVRGSGLRPTPPEPPREVQGNPGPRFHSAVRGSGLRPTPPEDSEDLDRVTLCLSSQVGCAMGCTFCATGQMGIVRNLTAAEIVGHAVAMLAHHGHPQERPVNLVFMGMGEPLHNLDHLMAAFDTLTDPEGLAIPPRRITVSTSGLVPGILRLGSFPRRPRLALSLNGTTDEHRSRIMPVNRVWNLEVLAETLAQFPLQPGERITLEYVLLKGLTDTPADGKRLAAFARRFPAKVNLIPFNPHEGTAQNGPSVGTRFEPPDESRISALLGVLAEAGVPCTVRRSRGQDIAGACGQLVREGRRGS